MLPLPVGRRLTVQKYYVLRERVQAELPDVELDEAPVATDSEWACRSYGRLHRARRAPVRSMRASSGRLAFRGQRKWWQYTSPSAILLYSVPPPGEIWLLR